MRGGTAALAAGALALAGCGSSGERQDADEQPATYTVAVSKPEFPARQRLAETTELRIRVRNEDDRTIPNLAATIETVGVGTEAAAFSALTGQPDVASRSRPVWIIDEGPLSGTTAYANTWAIGPLEAGEEKTLLWRTTAVRAGRWRLRYRLAGSLSGNAAVVRADGARAAGRFNVDVLSRPRPSFVAEDGRVIHPDDLRPRERAPHAREARDGRPEQRPPADAGAVAERLPADRAADG